VHRENDAKPGGIAPGGASLHNCMLAHGPDAATYDRASTAALAPAKIDNTLAFMFEAERVIRPTRFALETPALQGDYDACWSSLERHFSQ
jgi:homogentisate 1,2-dioxygenase